MAIYIAEGFHRSNLMRVFIRPLKYISTLSLMRVFIRPPVHDNWPTLVATVTFLQFSGNRFTELGASFNTLPQAQRGVNGELGL